MSFSTVSEEYVHELAERIGEIGPAGPIGPRGMIGPTGVKGPIGPSDSGLCVPNPHDHTFEFSNKYSLSMEEVAALNYMLNRGKLTGGELVGLLNEAINDIEDMKYDY